MRGLPGRMEEIREAFEKLDWQQLSLLAHRLKGASGSYGYPDLERPGGRDGARLQGAAGGRAGAVDGAV